MKILAFDCSATAASCAVLEDNKVIASSFVNVKLTHSETLLPMLESTLASAKLSLTDINAFAINNGPGSFTGIRIGISAIKGMAQAKNLPCAAVSTLRAMAENYLESDCIICGVMDARANQVYNAFFDITGGKVRRICKDRAISTADLSEEIKKISQSVKKSVIIVGDGTDVFFKSVENIPCVVKSEEVKRYQNACGIATASVDIFRTNNAVSPDELLPTYLRLPQAERELKKKRSGENL
jgi:tRNA threonylcarbamoyladenosine biosynthesis protein TsaB